MPLEINDDVLGVLVIEGAGVAAIDAADLRHLAVVAASILSAIDRHSSLEHRLRREKLASTGQLIEGLVRELHELREQPSRIDSFVARLTSLAKSGPAESHPVDLRPILLTLIREHRDLWRAQGLKVSEQFDAGDSLIVLGSASQLEQILRLVLAASAECAIEGSGREIELAASVQASFGHIVFSIPGGAAIDTDSRLLLGRTLLQALGGELRYEARADGGVRFEVLAPLWGGGEKVVTGTSAPLRAAAAIRTALVLDPDDVAGRQLVASLSRRSIRAVPVDTFDEALDQLERFRFDLFFCASQATGGDWSILRERLLDASRRFETPGRIVLLTEPQEEEMARSLESLGVMVSQRSSGELEMARLLSS